jgi:succinate dehydrogenase / fumarate reductase, cytochrome b subunit
VSGSTDSSHAAPDSFSQNAANASFLVRHEFLIRRLHSLSGLVPLGAYMVVHLTTNSTLLNGARSFQFAVNLIHKLGALLPLVEWGFIFFPLLFHGLVGVWIWRSGISNTSQYRYGSNRRYAWQRWTGLIALVFLLMHVFHLHGWFHFHLWMEYLAKPLGMAQFKPYNAASTLALALDGVFWPAFYAVGVLACVYHLANGIWTAGITWGLWITPKAQARALKACTIFGIGLGLLGMLALGGAMATDPEKARIEEDEMYIEGVKTGLVIENPEKRSEPVSATPNPPAASAPAPQPVIPASAAAVPSQRP